MLADNDCTAGLGLLDGLPPGKCAYVGKWQRILYGQILQDLMSRGGQRRDELLDLGGQPTVVVPGRFDVDAGQQVVAPESRYLVGYRPVGRDVDDERRRSADRQLVDQRGGQPVEQMRVVND